MHKFSITIYNKFAYIKGEAEVWGNEFKIPFEIINSHLHDHDNCLFRVFDGSSSVMLKVKDGSRLNRSLKTLKGHRISTPVAMGYLKHTIIEPCDKTIPVLFEYSIQFDPKMNIYQKTKVESIISTKLGKTCFKDYNKPYIVIDDK